MQTTLYINDNNLLLQRADSITQMRGYALFKDDNVVFEEASKQCRLDPQRINNRYWQQCDQSTISQNAAGMRHSGDLIWKQLSLLKQQFQLNNVALVAPSHYQTNNLQLLLGISKSAGIGVNALINKSVLLLCNEIEENGDFLHIDLQLNQTVCSTVRSAQGELSLGSVEVLHEVSIQVIQDALLKAMQHRFIQSDRFDPLHHAETEQQLFDQIGEAAAAVANDGKANLLVQHQSKLHTVSIDQKQWQAALKPYTDKLVKVASIGSIRRAFLQGNDLFSGADAWHLSPDRFSLLDESRLPDASQIPASPDGAENITYVTTLPSQHLQSDSERSPESQAQLTTIATENTEPVAATADKKNEAASHLLCGGLAIPLQKAHISTDGSQLGVSINGSANALEMLRSGQLFVINDPERKTVAQNDRLGSNLADGLITVIHVRE